MAERSSFPLHPVTTKSELGLLEVVMRSFGVLLLVLGGMVQTASADWTRFDTVGLWYAVDTMEIFIVDDTGAGPFQNDGIFDVSNGWTGSLVNPNYVMASGSPTDGISYTLDFAGDMDDSVKLNLMMWEGGVFGSLKFAASFSWVANQRVDLYESFLQSSYWFLEHPDGIGYNRSPNPVPAPGAAVLGLIGLVMVGRGCRRKGA